MSKRINLIKQTAIILLLATFKVAVVAAATDQRVRMLWKGGEVKGHIEVQNATLSHISICEIGSSSDGKTVSGYTFRIAKADRQCLSLYFSAAQADPGPEPALVTVRTGQNAFSFFLRDVTDANPIFIPAYGVAVVSATDLRSYRQVEDDINARGLLTKAARTNLLPETSFEQVASHTRNMNVPIWLGLSRDVRLFEITEEMQDMPNVTEKILTPTHAGYSFTIPETGNSRLIYHYALGRGVGPLNNIRRWIEDGALPVYHSEMRDDDVVYHSVSFASLENEPLTAGNVKGTDYLISDNYNHRNFTPEQQKQLEEKKQAMTFLSQEVVLYCRTQLVNTGQTPRYAWFKLPFVLGVHTTFDPSTGFSSFSSERVYCVSMLNGRPAPAEEMAVLIQPGDTLLLDFRLTHKPVDALRAAALREKSYDEQYAACCAYWQGKLDRTAKIHIPEKRIDEMLRANLLHLDLITMGIEPDEPLAAKVGVYTPIGTESAPIIQYYCSVGLDAIARRSLDYFFATQHSDGQILNFNGYTVETGAVLWSVGEYFRYTRDAQWIRKMKPGILKACDYLMNWRQSDKSGLGMISGKVADPEDPFCQFMLNGYAYLGMSRIAEVMRELGEPEAQRLTTEAAAWREAIRKAALDAMEKSPVAPLGDGTWCPTLPPWPEAPGPRLFYQKAENFRSHGTFTVADAMLGPVYLVFCEVFDPDDPVSQTIMNYTAELMYQGNAGFSQPYYGRVDWWLARTGRVKPFLNAYYTTFSAHADRQTYTFWEHLYRLSSHKTHEVGRFLMNSRWMLYMEQGDTLNIFPVIPRAWLQEDKHLSLDGVRSYFGTLNVAVTGLKNGVITATVECQGERKPRNVMVRLPHPDGKKAVTVTGGTYIPEKESVLIENFTGQAQLRLEFSK